MSFTRRARSSAKSAWRKTKPHLPGPVRRAVQPVASKAKRVARQSRAGSPTLDTGLLRDRSWIPTKVTRRARGFVRKARTS